MSKKVEVDAIEKWDIIDRKWKIDWSVRRSKADIDVSVKVQIGVVADVIEEAKARVEIANIVANSEIDWNDPSYV